MFKPKSVIRDQSDFVLLPCRLSVAFAEGVADHVETKQRRKCRQEDENGWEAKQKHQIYPNKEKMLKLMAMDGGKVDRAFYALPYNPYGKKADYKWTFPKRWFNMQEDRCVLIGNEFWNFVGGEGTYDMLVNEINKIGIEYRERIYREYLGMNPPENNIRNVLK